MSIADCQIIELPRITDPRGNLTFIEGTRHIPFEIARVYYLYDVPGGTARDGNGHRRLRQLIIAISGSFDVRLDDGRDQRTFSLNRSYNGLYIPQMIWREVTNFSSGSVCCVLASEPFEESDYIREYSDFVREAAAATSY